MQKMIWFIIVVLLCLIIFVFVTADYGNKTLKILIRYDDCSEHSDTNLETELFKIAKSKKGGILVAVIPYPGMEHPLAIDEVTNKIKLSKEKIALLNRFHQDGVIEIAIHGFNHRNNNLLGYKTEFGGLTESNQSLLLLAAKNGFEQALGLPVTSFVPPYNQFDRNTLVALKKTGFNLLSANFVNSVIESDDIDYIPGGPYPYKLRSIINFAIYKNHFDALIVPTAHPYDIIEFGQSLPSFRKDDSQVSFNTILQDLNYIEKMKNVQFISIAGLRKNKENLSSNRFVSNRRLKDSFTTKHRLIPGMLGLYPLPGLYYSFEAANDMYLRQLIIVISFYLVVFLIVYSISINFLTLFNNVIIQGVLVVLGVLGLVIMIVKIFLGQLYFLSVLSFFISIGLLSSVGLYNISHRN